MLVATVPEHEETLAERLRRLRAAKGLSRDEVGTRSGGTPSASYVRALEEGRQDNPSALIAAKLANLYGVTVEYLLGLPSGSHLTAEIPLKGYVSAGSPRETCEADLGTVSVPGFVREQFPQSFALIISGDSLSGDSISDGDLVVVDPSAGLQIGKIYIIRLEDETVARHLFIEEGHVRLKSANDHYVDLKVAELDIIGRVVWHMRKM